VVIFSVSPVLAQLLLCLSSKALEQQVESRGVQLAGRFVFNVHLALPYLTFVDCFLKHICTEKK
jgi:hypothetical protein